ncbi:MAG: SGNH/GDSL hydrolase family protein [Planctomycetota bacterium]
MYSTTQLIQQVGLRLAVLYAAVTGLAVADAAQADPNNILAFSDSITYGQGDDGSASEWRGYSDYLQELLMAGGYVHGPDYDFIGGLGTGSGLLSDGITPFDADRWGSQGALAAGSPNSNPFVGGGSGTKNLVYQLQNYATSQDGGTTLNGVFTGLNAAGTAREIKTADTLLIHIGTNPLLGDSPSSPRFGSQGTVAETTAQFGSLLTELRTQWDAGRIAQDANIFVARIIPKAENSGGSSSDDDATVRNTALYNDQMVGLINDLPTTTAADAAFKSMFTVVDMFDIQITPGLQNYLTPQELALVNIDGDNSVDWVLGLDESDPGSFNDDTLEVNSALLTADQIHPTDLAYKVMAYQWYEAMKASGAVPEPGSFALVSLGLLSILSWRPRRSAIERVA